MAYLLLILSILCSMFVVAELAWYNIHSRVVCRLTRHDCRRRKLYNVFMACVLWLFRVLRMMLVYSVNM